MAGRRFDLTASTNGREPHAGVVTSKPPNRRTGDHDDNDTDGRDRYDIESRREAGARGRDGSGARRRHRGRTGGGVRVPRRPERSRRPPANDDARLVGKWRRALRDELRVLVRATELRFDHPAPIRADDGGAGRRLDAAAAAARDRTGVDGDERRSCGGRASGRQGRGASPGADRLARRHGPTRRRRGGSRVGEQERLRPRRRRDRVARALRHPLAVLHGREVRLGAGRREQLP